VVQIEEGTASQDHVLGYPYADGHGDDESQGEQSARPACSAGRPRAGVRGLRLAAVIKTVSFRRHRLF